MKMKTTELVNYVDSNVKLVFMNTIVLSVKETESITQNVPVHQDTSKLCKIYVQDVTINVLNVLITKNIVISVLKTESMYQFVLAHLVTMPSKMLLIVQLVTKNVFNVFLLLTTVLFVLKD